MEIVYRCKNCGAEFSSEDACMEHEITYQFTVAMAIAVLRQAEFDTDDFVCHACPRGDCSRCSDCMNKARDKVLAALEVALKEDEDKEKEQSKR